MTLGYGDGTFGPSNALSRWQALTFMQRYYDEILGANESADFTRADMMVLLKAINDGTLRGTDTGDGSTAGTSGADEGQRFPDVGPDHYAFEAVEWAAAAGVTLGYGDGTFKPEVALSRWHARVFVERYYDEILGAEQPQNFTRADMMVLLKAINDGTLRDTSTGGFKAVSVGGAHTCGLRADNTITCWGDNTITIGSDLGDADAPSGTFKAVSAGGGHNCGLRADNTITCWGDNAYGQSDAPSA